MKLQSNEAALVKLSEELETKSAVVLPRPTVRLLRQQAKQTEAMAGLTEQFETLKAGLASVSYNHYAIFFVNVLHRQQIKVRKLWLRQSRMNDKPAKTRTTS